MPGTKKVDLITTFYSKIWVYKLKTRASQTWFWRTPVYGITVVVGLDLLSPMAAQRAYHHEQPPSFTPEHEIIISNVGHKGENTGNPWLCCVMYQKKKLVSKYKYIINQLKTFWRLNRTPQYIHGNHNTNEKN